MEEDPRGLRPQYDQSQAKVLEVARDVVPRATAFRIGPYKYGWGRWSVWIVTPTDEERDQLKQDPMLQMRLLAATADDQFPPCNFEFESQETVDRDYGGDWWPRVK